MFSLSLTLRPSRLGPQRRCRLTSTNRLSPESRYGNGVVVRSELMGPLGAWTTGLTFPSWVWRSADWKLDLPLCTGVLSGSIVTWPNMTFRSSVIPSDIGVLEETLVSDEIVLRWHYGVNLRWRTVRYYHLHYSSHEFSKRTRNTIRPTRCTNPLVLEFPQFFRVRKLVPR